MYKKGVLGSILVLLTSGLASAGPADNVIPFVNQVIEGMLAFIGPIFGFLLGEYIGGVGDFTQNEVFFAKVLLLILLILVINVAVKRVPAFKNQAGIAFVIAFVVSVLAVRYMSQNELILGVLLPYGTLGTAIITVLPFLIFFYFVHVTNMHGFMRRLSWIVFGIIFLVLWLSRSPGEITPVMNWIYGLTLVAIVLSLLFDKSIQRYFGTHELNVFRRGAHNKVIAGLQSEYLDILHVDSPQAERRRNSIENHLRRLGGSVP
tara:strand:- start:156 stop:941 length:786 start_codon:yes stop_codon:yes gene_type:complete